MEPSPFRTKRENEGPLFGLVLIRGSKAWPSYLCRRRLVHSFGGRFHMTPCPLQKIRCGCMSFVQLAQTRRGCLASFWIALVCRMWANHCLEVVLVSASASCCRLSVQHSSLPACRGLRFAFGSFGRSSFFFSDFQSFSLSSVADFNPSGFVPVPPNANSTIVKAFACYSQE